jgi:hypothetical protein
MLRTTRQQVEVLAAGNGKMRVSRQLTEVLASGNGKARVSRQFVEVLAAVPAPTIEVDATSTLSLAHTAAVNKIYQRSAEHSLTLNDEAVGDRVRLGMNTMSLSHEATGDIIKPVVNTVDVTHGASRLAVFNRLVVDTLGATEEVIVAYVKRVHSIDALEIADAVAVEYIKPVQQFLSLTHLVQVDLLRRSFDTLTPAEQASVLVTYAQTVEATLPLSCQAIVNCEILRSVEDALVPGQMAAGDLCKVGTHILTLTDGAEVSVIRLAHSDLALTHQADLNWVFTRRRVDALALAHVAAKSLVRSQSIVAALSLTHQATASVAKLVVNTLTLSHEATADNIRRASSTLVLTDTAVATNTRLTVQDDLLDLSSQAVVGFIKQTWAANALHLRDWARSGVVIGSVSSVLQELHYNYDPVTWQLVPYYIGLQDQAAVAVIHGTPYEARSILSLADRALGVVIHVDAKAGEAAHTLTLIQSAAVEQWPIVRDAYHAASGLLLTHAAAVVLVRPVLSTLALTHTAAALTWRAALEVVDALACTHAVGFVLISAESLITQYHPFVGEGSGGPVPPPASCPTPTVAPPCRLCYPVTSPTEFLILRSPEFSNKDRLQMNRISRETRGGTLVVYADPMWPKLETLVLTFRGLSASQVQDYLTFVRNHLGLEVGFVDWEGFYWKGVILNPEEPTVQDSKEVFTVSFEFEGEPAVWE